MTPRLRTLAWIFAIAPVLVVAVLYAWLPEQCVMQWSASGHPNWSAPKADFAISTLVAPAIGCVLLLNPGGIASRSMARWGRRYGIVTTVILAVAAVAEVAATLANLRH